MKQVRRREKESGQAGCEGAWGTKTRAAESPGVRQPAKLNAGATDLCAQAESSTVSPVDLQECPVVSKSARRGWSASGFQLSRCGGAQRGRTK